MLDISTASEQYPKLEPTKVKDGKMYLQDVEPCILPCIDQDADGPIQLKVMTIPLEAKISTESLCRDLGIERLSFFKTVWLLVLRSYVETDMLCFGYTDDRSDPHISSYSFNLCKTDRVRQLLLLVQQYQGQRYAPIHSSPDSVPCPRLFNTLVINQKSSGEADGAFNGSFLVQNTCFSEVDVALVVSITPSSCSLQINYNALRIPDDQATRISQTFQDIAFRISSDPDQLVSSIRLLSAWDEEHIWRWNRKPLKTVTSCVHHLIEERTRKCPDAHAVCAWDGTLTYAALDDLSSSLGSYLKTLGIGPETFVPLCVEKSKWAVVATLAVLKAGGACVHLSASYPIDRVTDILHMVEAKVLIVSPEFATQFKSKVDHVVCVTQSLLEKVLPTARRSCKDVQPKNAAFVVFTSGSTGQPKGVIKDHLSISSSAHAHASAFLVSSKSRVLQFAAYVWAISIYDMVSTLIQGGCVVIPSETARMNSLAWTIRELQVNHATLSPSIVKLIRPADVPMLQTLVLGGEEISKSVIDDWSDHVQIFNNYGSSETLCSLTCSLKRGDNGTTLGYATTANRCWIVDTNHHDRLVSIGGIGELLVEGHIIARSYLHDQKNTDRAFITNPAWQYDFLTRAGQLRRYYKTGDLVRYDLNGKIVFIGRKDSQVKLRGQRIELAEVEYHLQRYLPDAGEAVAGIVTILGVKERKALAAFVCPPSEWQAISSKNGSTSTWKDQVTLLIKGLEAKLSSSLPAHMIPSVYFPITKLPRTASGKLNRKLLAQMAEKLPAEQRLAYTESANKLETMSSEAGILLQHWRQVLPYDLAIAYADDNFFHMGGNSIDAIELVNSLHKDGWNLTVGDIFRYPTLNAMSRMLMVDQHPNEEAPVPFSLIPRSEIESLCTEAADQCNIAQEMVEDIYPCTPLQEGLMALSMRQPGAYVAQHVFALPKDWDLVAFKEAWNRVVSENSILRTRLIRTESHGWLQVVVNENVEWTVGGSMEDYRSSALNKIMDFGGPLMRCGTVSATGSDAAQFVWTIHHSIYDGWSVPLILKSVQEVYQHKHTTKAGDFNRFIQYILNIDRELSETYWRSQLADWGGLVFPRLPSTAYQPRPNSIERLEIHMPKNRTGLTTSTIIRAAWSLLLARHTNERDVVFGATVAGRSVPVQGIKDLIGPTISTVPVRIQLDYEKTVEAFLQDIQNHSTEMMAHEQFGLQNINRIGPDAANACQFQNLLIVQPMLEQIGESELKQIAIHSTDYLTFALTLECSLVKDGISIEATFDDIVLDCKQMKRLLLQFEQVLFQIQSSVQDGRKLRDITILSSADREEILAWNSHLPIVVDSCLHVLIQGRAESHHSATALCSWDGEMSYGELNVLSTRLGHELATRGVGPEVFVPLCFEKSSWTVIAILAVMKAGGAFVLLDPSHPVERLGSIVHSVGASLIVASPQQLQLCLGLAENIVPLDRAYVEQLTVNNQEVASHVKSHNALYVTFTSGSTGKPKGAVIEHRSCVSGFQAQAAAGFFDENSRVLQFASYSFDSSIEQILATLLVGGTICIPSDSERTSDLAGVMNRLAVNLADLTPSVAGLLEPAEVPDLRILRLSGESIPSTLIQKWAGRVRLENSYGPSECSVTSVANCQVLLDTDRTNIGRSIGCLTWIVESDESMKLAPIGTVGELVIQGPIIGRGYLNDLQETAAAFMEHVTWLGCTAEFPSRLYRTGDLARYDSKGDILFVGRKDTQIKLRGQRIELSEIECLLVTQAAIEACVAVVPRSGPYCDRIIATVKLPNPAGNTGSLNHYGIRLIATDRLSFVDAEIARLQLHLEKVLPTYMIPSAWAVVEQLPLLTSGKLDRKAIGLWLSNMYEVERYAMRTVSSDAQNLMPIPPNEPLALELSTKIALLVAKYDAQLGTKVRGQDVALQNAGLDSISIIALLKDINKTYSVSLDLAVLLRGITIRELARHIEGKRNGVASNFSREADSAMSNFIQEVNRLRSQFLDSATCQGHLTSSTQRGPQTIFLTGATGYLGTQILRDSLNRPGIRKVIAHVRAKTPEEGIQKLKRSAMAAEWWSEKYAARLEIWIGDLGKPFLGLTTRQWQRLSGAALPDDCINFIIHNGAVVNWYSNYASLRNANVLSVAYLLQAVKMSGFATRLVYISGGPQWDPDSEDDSDEWFNAQLASSNGYGQSKLVAERLVSSSLRTLTTTFENRISIIKPGFVIGTRTEGVANVDDFIWRIVAGSISIQAYSEETKASWIFVTSSDDFSSQILGYLDQDQGNPRAVQKLRGGLTVRDFWGVIEMKYGLELQPLKHDEWLMRLKLDVDEKGDTHPCGPIMHMAEQGPEILGTQAPANLVDTSPKAELLMAVERNIQYLLDIGFLPSKHQMQRQTRQEVIFRRSGRVLPMSPSIKYAQSDESSNTAMEDCRVNTSRPLMAPWRLQSQISPKSSEAIHTVLQGRRDIASIISQKSDRLLVAVGPCSIHDPDAALEYARKLKALSKTLSSDLCIVMRVYLEKPRTSIGWKGLINDPDLDDSFNITKGLRTSRQLFSDVADIGLPIITELLDTNSPQYFEDLISLGVVGARTTESQLHRELASGVSFPVGFKNGTDGGVQVAVNAIQAAATKHHFISISKQGMAAIVHTSGNKSGFLILRGGTRGTNFDATSVENTKLSLQASGQRPVVVVDCSHGNSNKDYRNQPSVAAHIADQVRGGDQGIVGVMLESNLYEGRQDLDKDGRAAGLRRGVSITDGCIGWDTTVLVLENLAAAVRERRFCKG